MSANAPTYTKVSGYLEKKCKIKIKSWKKYWFVLEGRLLLYYRSKEEYDSISPCKGSVNLGPPCHIKPTSINNAFQIETRANTIILRAADRVQQEKWMQAILTVLKQSTVTNDRKHIDFRYSNDDLVQESLKKKHQRHSINDRQVVERIKSIGGQSYGGSMGAINKATETMKKMPLVQSQSLVKLLQSKNVLEKTVSLSSDYLYSSVDKSKKSLVLIENDQYVANVALRKKERLSTELYERLSIGRGTENWYERVSKDSAQIGPPEVVRSVLVENDEYASLPEMCKSEPEYAVPVKKTDKNKNSVLLDNDLYTACGNVNEYYEISIPDDASTISECLYFEPETCSTAEDTYVEILKSPNGKQQKEPLEARKKRTTFARLRMSASRVSKMWRRKNKMKPGAQTASTVKCGESATNSAEILEELQRVLETKKLEIEERVRKSKEDDARNHKSNHENARRPTEEKVKLENDSLEDPNAEANNNLQLEAVPQLPPPKLLKKSSSSLSIYDVPTNNLPIAENVLLAKKNRRSFVDGSAPIKTIDEILEDLDKDNPPSRTNPSVKELIEIFDDKSNVVLRNKITRCRKYDVDINEAKNSEDLNKLLQDLAKITNAPILTPGITNSLNVPQSTTKEWPDLKLTVNRRNSDPDYDIPRSHKPRHLLQDTSELLINNYVKNVDAENADYSSEDDDSSGSEVFVNAAELEDSLEMNRDSDEIVFISRISHDFLVKPTSGHFSTHDFHNQNSNAGQSLFLNNIYRVYENDYQHKRDSGNHHLPDHLQKPDEVIYAKPRILKTSIPQHEERPGDTKSMDVFIDSLDTCGESSTLF